MKLVQKTDHTDLHWDNFKFMVFDVPNHNGTYQERYQTLGKLVVVY